MGGYAPLNVYVVDLQILPGHKCGQLQYFIYKFKFEVQATVSKLESMGKDTIAESLSTMKSILNIFKQQSNTVVYSKNLVTKN